MSNVDLQKLPVLYRAANDIFSSPKGYYRNSDGTYFSGNADITYLSPEDQINVANLIIQLTKSTIGEFSTKWKLATGTSPNAILEWGNKRLEIQIAVNYTKYEAYGFDPSEIQQPVLRNILNQKQRTVNELDKIISRLRNANAINGLSSTALSEVNTNTNTTPHITTSDRSQRPANTFEEMVSASRQNQVKGRILGG